jgi:hypothetical protein
MVPMALLPPPPPHMGLFASITAPDIRAVAATYFALPLQRGPLEYQQQ